MVNPPFSLHRESGAIKTTTELKGGIPTYRFAVQAKDNPGQASNQNSIDAEVVVSYCKYNIKDRVVVGVSPTLHTLKY